MTKAEAQFLGNLTERLVNIESKLSALTVTVEHLKGRHSWVSSLVGSVAASVVTGLILLQLSNR